MHDLADNPAHAAARQNLRDRLLRELRENNAPRLVESECRFEKPPFTNLGN